MNLIISDANIFIDLDCAGLTALMFRLEIDFAVPDILYDTELRERHGELPGLGLRVMELAYQAMRDARRRLPVGEIRRQIERLKG